MVVARRFLSKITLLLISSVSFIKAIVLVGLIATVQFPVYAQHDSPTLQSSNGAPNAVEDLEGGGFLAEITVNSPEEVERALKRAEQLFEQGAVTGDTGPATFVLFGPEVSIFLKENYEENKTIVDLAARLSAFKIVDIKVCELHLGRIGHDKNSIHPFVGTVPYGPGEVDRLIKEERYSYF